MPLLQRRLSVSKLIFYQLRIVYAYDKRTGKVRTRREGSLKWIRFGPHYSLYWNPIQQPALYVKLILANSVTQLHERVIRKIFYMLLRVSCLAQCIRNKYMISYMFFIIKLINDGNKLNRT